MITYAVARFRKCRHLAKVFPERFKLDAKVVDGILLWALYELKEDSLKPKCVEESHGGLTYYGWNRDRKRVHGFDYGVYSFVIFDLPHASEFYS